MIDAFGALEDERRWVMWREEHRRAGGKPNKIPYCPHGGPGKTDDPATWADRATAQKAARHFLNGSAGGIAVVLGDLGHDVHLGGLDLDSCLDDGIPSDWADDILGIARTYAEVSPSGRGLKLYFYIASEDVRPFLDAIGVDRNAWGTRRGIGPNSGDHGPAVEFYTAVRFFAVTGQHWAQSPPEIRMLDWERLAALAELIPAAGGAKASDFYGGKGRDGSRSARAFGIACQFARAGRCYVEMVAALRADPITAAWVREKGEAYNERELKRVWEHAQKAAGGELAEGGVALDDFWAYMPMHNYIFAPTRALWPASSVNARLPAIPLVDANGVPVLDGNGNPRKIAPSAWLDKHKPVEQMTWAPGEPLVIDHRLIAEGGWVEWRDVHCFNLYRAPTLTLGDPGGAARWLEHVRRVYPVAVEAEHILDWLAHRVQRPAEKINHALVLGGEQGAGKDTIVEPVKRAIGPWNGQEESPRTILDSRFNGYLKAVILRISEARDLGESDRFAFYDHMKSIIAAPPDVLRVNEKNIREYYIPNCCGVIITTNHKTDGIHLPADDRRHFVAWSPRKRHEFTDSYWRELWSYYDDGGDRDVAAYLARRPLDAFNPKAAPPQTPAFWDIVNASRSPEDAEMADALDRLGNPDAVTLADIIRTTLNAQGLPDEFGEWLRDRRNRRRIPHRLEVCGYVAVRNPHVDDGLWIVAGRRQVIYSPASLSYADQLKAAKNHV